MQPNLTQAGSQSRLRELFNRAEAAVVAAEDFSPGTAACEEALYWLNFGFRVLPVCPNGQKACGIAPLRSLADALKTRQPAIACLFGSPAEIAAIAGELRAAAHPPLLAWAEHPEALENAPDAPGMPILTATRPSQLHAAFFDGSSPLFSCAMCGKCCEGRGGIVVSPRDLPRLCAFFGMPPAEVLARFTESMRGQPVLRCGEDGFCMFFRSGRGCTIHPARPAVCRAWPFFRGNLVDRVSLAMAREDCPGICRQCRYEDFAREGWRYLTEYRLLADDPRTEGRMLIVKKEELPAARQTP